jgi:CPA2 family monovalent cation:H+ antiporter-2
MLIYENILLIIWLLFGIILLKMLIIYTIIRPFYGNTIALRTALTLFQIWELAIVVFETANVNGVLDSNTSQILIITIVISIILTPFVLQYLDKIVWFILKSSHKPENNIPNKKLENHIILIGYWETGILLSNMLEKEKKDHYIVEHNIYKFQEAKDSWKLCFYWDASKNNILESLNIEKASWIIISLWDSSKLIYICDTLSQLWMEWKTIVNVINKRQKAELEKLNFSHIIYKSEEVSKWVFAELSQLEQKTQKSKNSKSLNEIRDDTWT